MICKSNAILFSSIISLIISSCSRNVSISQQADIDKFKVAEAMPVVIHDPIRISSQKTYKGQESKHLPESVQNTTQPPQSLPERATFKKPKFVIKNKKALDILLQIGSVSKSARKKIDLSKYAAKSLIVFSMIDYILAVVFLIIGLMGFELFLMASAICLYLAMSLVSLFIYCQIEKSAKLPKNQNADKDGLYIGSRLILLWFIPLVNYILVAAGVFALGGYFIKNLFKRHKNKIPKHA